MRNLLPVCAIVFTMLFCLCDKSSNPDDPGQESIITMTFDGESVTLDGGPSTASNSHIQINGVPSNAYNGAMQILVNGSGVGTYTETNARVTFTSKEGLMYLADSSMISYGAKVELIVTEMGPGLKATLTATAIQSMDPNFTQKKITAGSISLTSDDIIISRQ
jgi:hypothetical protein